jgi:hypothetical protein
MARNRDDVIALSVKIDHAMAEAMKLELTTSVYLLQMVQRDLTAAVYGDEEGDHSVADGSHSQSRS